MSSMASVAYPHPGFLNPVPKHSLHKPLPFDLRSLCSRNLSISAKMADPSSSPVVQIERITVPNSYGEKLVGLLHETGSKEVVVLCHGFRASKDHEIMRNLAGALTREGISAVRFDFAGNGESEGSFQYGNYQREADDLHAVVLYLLRSNRVVKAILGHSKGGNVVLLYASRYHDVPIVVNVSGRYDLNKGIEERVGKGFIERIKKDGFIDVNGKDQYRITEESLMDRLSTDMHAACLSIEKSCRVLTVHGSEDEIIPVGDAFEFNKIIPNHKLHVIEGADHGYTKHQVDLAKVVVEFIKAVPKEAT